VDNIKEISPRKNVNSCIFATAGSNIENSGSDLKSKILFTNSKLQKLRLLRNKAQIMINGK
jgi:hypothetical protein